MTKRRRQRRQSQNSRYMRQILDRLREYDVEEVRLLCERYRLRRNARTGSSQTGHSSTRTSR